MFAEKMKELRRRRHMTQAELAAQLGLSASAVGMYEQGRREPELSVILRLCEIFGVTADDLLYGRPMEDGMEMRDVIHDIQTSILSDRPLTLDGVPLSDADRRHLANAIEISAAVALDQMKQHKPGGEES